MHPLKGIFLSLLATSPIKMNRSLKLDESQRFLSEKISKVLALSILSAAVPLLVEIQPSTAQTCNVYGCSQRGAGACNPYGCPNPGAGTCNPYGCPKRGAVSCNPYGCPNPGAGTCNPYGCPKRGAGDCNPYGCPNPGAGTCNPYGCPKRGAVSCNPYGCPNPGAAACNPYGCPASPQNSNRPARFPASARRNKVVYNRNSRPITGLYVVPTNSESWGCNILPNRHLQLGLFVGKF